MVRRLQRNDVGEGFLAWTRARLFHTYSVLRRPMTMGVRGIVVDPDNRVFLIRHTYVTGWHFPGGGIERHETALESLRRELSEEGNFELPSTPQLLSLHFNRLTSMRDHVAVYLVRDWTQSGPKQPDREIAEAGFFALDALPEDITRGTKARIDEVFGGAPVSEFW